MLWKWQWGFLRYVLSYSCYYSYHNMVCYNIQQPEDLEVSTTLLNKFRVEPDCVLKETAICNNTCYVLPK